MIEEIVGLPPETLNTMKKLAESINNDDGFVIIEQTNAMIKHIHQLLIQCHTQSKSEIHDKRASISQSDEMETCSPRLQV